MSTVKGRLAEQYTTAQGSGCAGTKITDEGFSYDAVGRTTDFYESTPHSGGYYHTTAVYNPNNTIQSLAGIPGYSTLTYGLDGEGRRVTVQQGTTKFVCDSSCSTTNTTTFDPAGHVTKITIGGVSDTDVYTYEASTSRMKTYSFTVGSTPKSMTGTLTWNSNGTLSQLAVVDGFNAGGSQTCKFGDPSASVAGYDDMGRLISANCGSIWAQTFSYDQYDNITKTGSSTWACVACYDSTTNRYNSVLASLIAYDANGNLLNDTIQQYTWDSYGHPASIAPPTGATTCGTINVICSVYDASGNMVEKRTGASTYAEMLYTPVGKTATMSGQTVSTVYLPMPGGATIFESGATNGNGAKNFWHKDWLGTVRLETGLGGRNETYDRAFAPYGEMYDNFGVTTRLNFTGDNSGHDHQSVRHTESRSERHSGAVDIP